MNRFSFLTAGLVVGALGFLGCDEGTKKGTSPTVTPPSTSEGKMDRAKEDLKDAGDKTKDAAEDVGDAAKKTGEDIKEGAEKTGEAVKDKAEDVGDAAKDAAK
jgi:hypothetical protein